MNPLVPLGARRMRALFGVRSIAAWYWNSYTTSTPLAARLRPAGYVPPALKDQAAGSKVLAGPTSMGDSPSRIATNIGRRFACACYSLLRPRTSVMRVASSIAVVDSGLILLTNPFTLLTAVTPNGITSSATISYATSFYNSYANTPLIGWNPSPPSVAAMEPK
jgi:hypothetical protein